MQSRQKSRLHFYKKSRAKRPTKRQPKKDIENKVELCYSVEEANGRFRME